MRTLCFSIAIFYLASFAAHAVIADRQRLECHAQPRPGWPVERLIRGCAGLLADPVLHNPEPKGDAYYKLGLLYQLDGKVDIAVAAYTKAIGWERQSGDIYAARGDAYESLGQHDNAKADYEQAARLSQDTEVGLNERCWYRAIRGRPLDLALRDCDQALQQKPSDWMALDSRCLVHFRAGDYAGAISDCSAALTSEPKFAPSLYIRGLAKRKAGDTAGGDADIMQANTIDPKIAETYAGYGVRP